MSAEDVPAGWASARLDAIAEIRLGRQRSPQHHSGDSMVPYLRAANLTWGGVDVSDVKTMNFTPDEVETYRLLPGDILLSEASGSASEVGKPGIWKGDLLRDTCFQNTLLRVRAEEGVDVAFLFYRLLHECRRGGFAASSRGVGIHHLGSAKLAGLRVAMPSSAQQRALSDTLSLRFEELGYSERSLGKLLIKLRALRRAVLARMVRSASAGTHQAAEDLRDQLDAARQAAGVVTAASTDLGIAPAEGFVTASLDQLTDPGRKAAYGVLQPGAHVPGGVPLIRVGDIVGGAVATSGTKCVAPAVAAAYPRTMLRGGELLVTLVGTIGRTAVAPRSLAGANVARAVGVVPLADGVNADYIALCLQAEPYASALAGRAHEVARKTLNLADVRAFPVPLASTERQAKLAEATMAQLAVLDRAILAAQTLLRRVDTVRDALLASAFADRLLPDTTNDDPPDVLLKQIQAVREARQATAPPRRRSTVPMTAALTAVEDTKETA